jgi:hypothetical protein
MKRKFANELIAGDVFVTCIDDAPPLTRVYLYSSITRLNKRYHSLTFLSRAECNQTNYVWQEIIVLESLGNKPTVIFFDDRTKYEII